MTWLRYWFAWVRIDRALTDAIDSRHRAKVVEGHMQQDTSGDGRERDVLQFLADTANADAAERIEKAAGIAERTFFRRTR